MQLVIPQPLAQATVNLLAKHVPYLESYQVIPQLLNLPILPGTENEGQAAAAPQAEAVTEAAVTQDETAVEAAQVDATSSGDASEGQQ